MTECESRTDCPFPDGCTTESLCIKDRLNCGKGCDGVGCDLCQRDTAVTTTMPCGCTQTRQSDKVILTWCDEEAHDQ